MAYTPINWQTGDTITAEKMNKMDNGWGVQNTQLFSENVTTEDDEGMNIGLLVYSQTIDSDSITVTFNGTDYTCPRIDAFDEYFYGGFSQSGPDFSVFPFAIESGAGENYLYTQTAGTYTVAVNVEVLALSENFCKAVGKVFAVPIFTQVEQNSFTCSMTFSEVRRAIIEGCCSYSMWDSKVFLLASCSDTTIAFAQTQVLSSYVKADFLVYGNNGSITMETYRYPPN